MYETVSDARVVAANQPVSFIMEMIREILQINKNCCCLFFNRIPVKTNNNGPGTYSQPARQALVKFCPRVLQTGAYSSEQLQEVGQGHIPEQADSIFLENAYTCIIYRIFTDFRNLTLSDNLSKLTGTVLSKGWHTLYRQSHTRGCRFGYMHKSLGTDNSRCMQLLRSW